MSMSILGIDTQMDTTKHKHLHMPVLIFYYGQGTTDLDHMIYQIIMVDCAQ